MKCSLAASWVSADERYRDKVVSVHCESHSATATLDFNAQNPTRISRNRYEGFDAFDAELLHHFLYCRFRRTEEHSILRLYTRM